MNIALIPHYGIEGAAFATSLSMILWNLLYFLKVRKLLPVTVRPGCYVKYIVSALLSLTVFFILNYFISMNTYTLIFNVIIYAFFYVVFILLTKSLTKEDLDILIAFEKKSGLNLKFLKKIIKKFL